LVLQKDLRIELSTGEVVTTSGFFALLITVIGSMSFFGGPDAHLQVAPGVIWVAIAFASVLALTRSWQRERDNDALSGLLVLPLAPSAIFAGKALGIACFVVPIQLLVVLATALLFHLELGTVGGGLAVLCVASAPGIAAAGTLFGAMTVRTAARELVLSGVLLSLLAPALLSAVAGTRELFGGASARELGDYVILLVVFAGFFTAGGLGLFGTLLES
jgi:heme exporter protein B